MGAVSPRVTVVIPTHDRWRMLRTALWSALNQERVELVVIVVDDGSTDETSERLRAVDDDRLTVVRLPRTEGVSAARNAGLERAATDWVAFLDDDDAWAPFHLSALLDAATSAGSKGAAVDIAYSGSVTVTRDRQVKAVRRAPAPERVPQGLLSTNVLVVPSRVLVRTEAARSAGGFDTAFSVAADWDLWLRMVGRDGLAAAPVVSVAYMLHGANMHLDISRAFEELRLLEARHADTLGSQKGSLADRCSRWIARSYRESGHRRQAAAWSLRAFRRHRQPRDLARAAGALLGEQAVERLRFGDPPQPPPEVEAWLEQIRAIDRLPPAAMPFR